MFYFKSFIFFFHAFYYFMTIYLIQYALLFMVIRGKLKEILVCQSIFNHFYGLIFDGFSQKLAKNRYILPLNDFGNILRKFSPFYQVLEGLVFISKPLKCFLETKTVVLKTKLCSRIIKHKQLVFCNKEKFSRENFSTILFYKKKTYI